MENRRKIKKEIEPGRKRSLPAFTCEGGSNKSDRNIRKRTCKRKERAHLLLLTKRATESNAGHQRGRKAARRGKRLEGLGEEAAEKKK